MHLEGIVSKRLDAPYESGRVESWTKSKCRAGHEVVIGGYVTTGGAFRSLIAGVNREWEPRPMWGGLERASRPRHRVAHHAEAEGIGETDKSPFSLGSPRKTADIHWLQPELVAEIEYEGFTGDGHLRQAAFQGSAGGQAGGRGRGRASCTSLYGARGACSNNSAEPYRPAAQLGRGHGGHHLSYR